MLIAEPNINKFFPSNDCHEKINNFEKEWKRISYRDERIWPYLVLLTLGSLPNKWYNLEEARGENFTLQVLKENFIKEFSFNTEK